MPDSGQLLSYIRRNDGSRWKNHSLRSRCRASGNKEQSKPEGMEIKCFFLHLCQKVAQLWPSVAVTRLTEPGAELGTSPSPWHNNATNLITKRLESQAVVTDYFQRGNCGSNKSKEGRWLENKAGLILCFPYSKLNPRGEYMLVGLFCLVTKGQRVAVSYKRTETKKCVGAVTKERPSLSCAHLRVGCSPPRTLLIAPHAPR